MVDILLATYNGAKYLPEQLDSLLAQSYSEFRVFVLDDASTDDTSQILRDYKDKYPDTFSLDLREHHTGDAAANFFALLSSSCCEYTMFCDQDDVWQEDKIMNSLRTIQVAEEVDAFEPLLVHTDLEVTDENLHPIGSFMHMQHLDTHFSSLERLVAQNNVTGCTMLFNDSLRSIIRPAPGRFMHDWWIALTAAAFGRVLYLPERTVLYRQHSNNAIGAVDARSASYVAKKASDKARMRESLLHTYDLASAFLKTYNAELSTQQQDFLDSYAHLGEHSWTERLRVLTRNHAFKKGILRKVAQVFYGEAPDASKS